MPRNSSGVYSTPPGVTAVPNTTIESTPYNTNLADIASTFTDSLSRSGQGGMLADLQMGGFKIGGMATPTLSADAVTKAYADALVPASGGPFPAELTVASATTTDILGAASDFIAISGTTTITSLGTGINRLRLARFTGVLTLTHNATSLILPGAANITTAAGDVMLLTSDGSSNVRVWSYVPAASATLLGVPAQTVASATTCNILGANTPAVSISGTTTITSLGTGTNKVRFVTFTGALTLTHNGTSLILPGAANITTAAGDTCIIVSDGSSNARVYAYQAATALTPGTYTNASVTVTARGSVAGISNGTIEAVNLQTFTSTGANTWTKPAGATANTRTLIEAWGGGGGGNSQTHGGGGGGGGYQYLWITTSLLGSTETATVGTGGATGNPASAGGNSTFGAWLTAYAGGGGGFFSGTNTGGGGGGGGAFGAGATATNVGGAGGGPAGGANGSPGADSTAGGGGGGNGSQSGGNSYFGGAGGSGNSGSAVGGNSVWGGGGGGGETNSGGTSSFVGNGGATGVAGSAPAGGGGRNAAGGRGEIRVTTFI